MPVYVVLFCVICLVKQNNGMWVEKINVFYSMFTNVFLFLSRFLRFLTFFYFFWNVFYIYATYKSIPTSVQ